MHPLGEMQRSMRKSAAAVAATWALVVPRASQRGDWSGSSTGRFTRGMPGT